MKLAIGADHGGFDLKEILVPFLKEKGIEVVDKGCYDTNAVDYPNVAFDVCGVLTAGEADLITDGSQTQHTRECQLLIEGHVWEFTPAHPGHLNAPAIFFRNVVPCLCRIEVESVVQGGLLLFGVKSGSIKLTNDVASVTV